MKSGKVRFGLALFGLLITHAITQAADAQSTLRVYVSGSNRPDLLRKMFDVYEQRTAGVKVVVETGGATSELQRQYLSTVLSARDSSLDVMQIDIVSPAQFMKAQWIEPLDKLLATDALTLLKPYLGAYAKASVVDGKVASLPAYVDAQFLFYRKDLLQKYALAEPRTWDELALAARKILDGEKAPALQGLSIQGAPIEGAVCTFLTPYWSQGKALQDAAGKLSLDKAAAEKGMGMWLGLIDQGVLKKNAAEVKTQDTTSAFRAGQAVFAVNWGFTWGRYQESDAAAKGKVGIAAMPAMPSGKAASCAGGWQWAVSAFSSKKKEAAALVQWLASPAVGKYLAINGAMMSAIPQVNADADVLQAMPWFAAAGPALEAAQTRPVSERYGEISDTVRTGTSAMLGRSQTVPNGVAAIESRLRRVLR